MASTTDMPEPQAQIEPERIVEIRQRMLMLQPEDHPQAMPIQSRVARLGLEMLIDVCRLEASSMLHRPAQVTLIGSTCCSTEFKPAFAVSFTCGSQQHAGSLRFDEGAARALANALLAGMGQPRGDGPPCEVETGLLEYAALDLADRLLSRLPASSLSFAQFAGPPDMRSLEPAPTGACVELDIAIGGLGGRARLSLDVADIGLVLPDAASLVTAWPELAESRLDRESEGWDVRLALHPVELTRAEFEAVEPGDVVLLGRASLHDCGPIDAIAALDGSLVASACIVEDRPASVTARLGRPETEFEPAEIGDSTESISDGPLRIVPLMASGRLSVEQVRRWPTGQTMEFAKDRDRPVELTVGGRQVGFGELVRVDADLGLRILAWQP